MDIESELHRSLLFGVIASQLHYLGPDDLARAMDTWKEQPGAASLGGALAQAGSLAPEDLSLLDQIVLRQAARHDGDFGAALLDFGGLSEARAAFARAYEVRGGKIVAGNPQPHNPAPATPAKGTWTAPDAPAPKNSGAVFAAPAPAPAEPIRPGAERYTIKGEHGRGAIGRVLLAVDEEIGREVALKELLPAAPGKGGRPRPNVAARDRFLREAKLTGGLNHPAIVPVYEIGSRADGSLYYTMRFVRGVTMQDRLDGYVTLAERIQLLPAFLDVCHAIAYAHSRGVVHRDIKPANVMLGQFGETVVLDWGLAKARGAEEPEADFAAFEAGLKRLADAGGTVPGQPFGSPCYMSPEQAYGRLEDIDEKSDVWSLGAMLYEVLTGQPPFMGRGAMEVVEQVRTGRVRPVRELEPEAPEELCAIAERCLCRERERRYADANAAAEKVAEVVLVLFGPMSFVRVREERNEAIEQRRRAEEARALAERREREARVNLAEAYFQYGLRAEEEARHSAARVYYARSLALDEREDSRSGLYRRALDSLAVRFLGSVETGRLTALRFSRDGKLLAGARDDGRVTVWEAASLKTAAEPGPFAEAVAAVDFFPDGQRIAAGVGDEVVIRAWEAAPPRIAPMRHDSDVTCALVLPDGLRIASGSADLTVKLWSAADGACMQTLIGHDDRVTALALSPDGARLASAGWDKTVKIWDPDSGRCLLTLAGHRAEINALAFISDALLLSGADDHELRVWDLATGQCLRAIAGHRAPVVAAAADPDHDLIASAGRDGEMRLASLPEGRVIHALATHPEKITAAAFGPGARTLAAAGDDGRVRTWSVERRERVTVLAGHRGEVTAATFTPDGRAAVTAGSDRAVGVHRLDASRGFAALAGHDAPVSSVAVSADGRRAVSGSWDDSARVWDLGSGSCLQTFAGHEGAGVLAVAFTPAGDEVVAVSYDTVVKRWSLRTGRCEKVYGLPGGEITAAEFDLARGRLLTGGCARKDGPHCREGRIMVWDLARAECILDARGHHDAAACVALSPDGTLAASGAGGEMALHPLDGSAARLLPSPRRPFRSAAFSADGAWLAGGAEDGTVTLWRVGSGEAAVVLSGPEGAVLTVAFSPDGGSLLSAGRDKLVRITPLIPRLLTGSGEELLKLAEAETGYRLEGFELRPR